MHAHRLGLRAFFGRGAADVAFIHTAEHGVVRRPILGQQLGQMITELDHALRRDHDLSPKKKAEKKTKSKKETARAATADHVPLTSHTTIDLTHSEHQGNNAIPCF